MESKKDDGPEKARFVAVRDEIYKRYTSQQKTKDQVASSVLKRSITHREEEGEAIEIDSDVTSPSAVKQDHHTYWTNMDTILLMCSQTLFPVDSLVTDSLHMYHFALITHNSSMCRHSTTSTP